MPALISTVRLDERRRPGCINVRRPLAGSPPEAGVTNDQAA